MDIKILRYFIAVAQEKNITKAAQRKVKERNIAEEQKDEIGVISSKVGGAIQIW